ncbi:Clp protease ClpP [Enterococcus faecalis]|uniref:head maturation protease, ClpP-related n=1 Tax=Enterococcus faecalis TaxID=1351 RepID=UPI0017831020|nr:head maturation protease, ClpP-related [Enterococcus faecalis]MBD9891129.1 ATP-dependent Clp protease proteolytic subunit [Enterococcus faecalis]MDR0026363.1 Clp protease ClpP [Enterococcus faecalis]MDT2226292.1 Clp protease ClpP [Enterococcus faecalis]
MTVKIKINGPIISNDDKWFYDWLDMDATCPKDVLDLLPEENESVEVTINSYGGLVDMGNEIYTALRSYEGHVKVNIVMAGSAASIIAMAGNTVAISPVGQIMIHNVAMGAGGDYHVMDKASEILQKANSSLANAYVAKTGKTKEEILALMDKETWLTAEEAIENGFVDEIMFENIERPLLVADAGSGLISKDIINEVKKLKNQQNESVTMVNKEELKEMIAEAIIETKQKEITSEQTIESKESTNVSPFARFLF